MFACETPSHIMLHSSLLSIFVIAAAAGLAISLIAQEKPLTKQGYQREELGVNIYTAGAHAALRKNSRRHKCHSPVSLNKATARGLELADVKAIHAQARELNLAIGQSD
jgi:hypothetical protein